MPIQAINPATGETVKTYDELTDTELEVLIQKADKAFRSWKTTAFSERAAYMRKAASILRERSDALAELAAIEMGKPIKEGRAEIEKCAWVCDYYAENAERFLAPEPVKTDADESYVAFEPLGVVLAVMPWNFPFWQVFRFAAPALMAGNVGLLKHASNVPGCALAIESIFSDAGMPEGCFTNLFVGSKHVAGVIEHPLVKAVTLTGSTGAGRAVASAAGRALKKTVLELGGSDPYLILEDADIDAAAEACAASRMINGGQSCIAAKRFIVVKTVQKAFEEKLVAALSKRVMGSPLEEATQLGPQARADLRDELHQQVLKSVEAGARLLLGGKIPEGKGAFYPPTVLSDVRKGHTVYEEETFGPVASVIPVADEAEAVRVANDTVFGLGAAVFTRDKERGKYLAEHAIEAGSCFVNGLVRSDPRLPFGGIKESGYGRELSSFGIREFVNIKTICVC